MVSRGQQTIRRSHLFRCLLYIPRNKKSHVVNHGGVADGGHLEFEFLEMADVFSNFSTITRAVNVI